MRKKHNQDLVLGYIYLAIEALRFGSRVLEFLNVVINYFIFVYLKYKSKFQLKPSVWVFVPTEESIAKGKGFKFAVEKYWKAPINYYHLRQGGHVEALKSHLQNSHFIHLDIQNFFGSINRTRVTRCLKGLFSYSVAREIANYSTVSHPVDKNSILPFGFVQSPIIASLCLDNSALGRYLRMLSKNNDVTVSVYVDDIIISSNDALLLKDIMTNIKISAARAGFNLNEKKEEGPSAKITAFNIELANQSMEITVERMRQLMDSYENTDSENVKKGIAGYIMSVNELQKLS